MYSLLDTPSRSGRPRMTHISVWRTGPGPSVDGGLEELAQTAVWHGPVEILGRTCKSEIRRCQSRTGGLGSVLGCGAGFDMLLFALRKGSAVFQIVAMMQCCSSVLREIAGRYLCFCCSMIAAVAWQAPCAVPEYHLWLCSSGMTSGPEYVC